MAVDTDYLKYVMELLAPLGGVTSRAMFGGYGIFHEGDMFALIAGSALFFKVDDSNRAAYEQAGSRQFKPMPYWEVPADILENTTNLHDWASISIGIAHAAPTKKKRR
jgi:DNA transformation protein